MSGDHNINQTYRDLEVIAAELRNEEDALELQKLVKEFFDKYLNYTEESDGGRLFNPVTISCCRVMMVEPLGELLQKMRLLSGAKQNPLFMEKNDE